MLHPSMVLSHVSYAYPSPNRQDPLIIFQDLNWEIYPQETLGLLGPSGSGKSTLLHLMGLLEEPSQGKIGFFDPNFQTISYPKTAPEKNAHRLLTLGFIYQYHHLLAELTALENVMLPLQMAQKPKIEAKERAEHLLSLVGLSHRMEHFPWELSGGQKQRVAIARALANHPKIILADEPTGSLDEETARKVFEVFLRLAQEEKAALVMATHNRKLAGYLSKIFSIQERRLAPVSPKDLA